MGNSFMRIFRWYVENELNENEGRLSEITILKLLYQSLCLLIACYVLDFVYDLMDHYYHVLNDDHDIDDDQRGIFRYLL